MKEISDERFEELKNYLFGREFDIADSIEDFGNLKELFKEIFKREPKC